MVSNNKAGGHSTHIEDLKLPFSSDLQPAIFPFLLLAVKHLTSPFSLASFSTFLCISQILLWSSARFL